MGTFQSNVEFQQVVVPTFVESTKSNEALIYPILPAH